MKLLLPFALLSLSSCVLYVDENGPNDEHTSADAAIQFHAPADAREVVFPDAFVAPADAIVALADATPTPRTPIDAPASNGLWQLQTSVAPPSTPLGRMMVYDSVHHQTVVVLGTTDDTPVQTWTSYDGIDWTNQTSDITPNPVYGAALAFDEAHGEVVMFGGSNDTSESEVSNDSGETWLWSGSYWRQAFPTTSPPVRDGATMTYDPVHQQVIMFGGEQEQISQADNSVIVVPLDDTWAWDGFEWQQMATSQAITPPARGDESLTFDAAHGEIVMFGGGGNDPFAAQSNQFFLNDTWIWDGASWHPEQAANSPSARVGATMAFDADRNVVVMFGGLQGQDGDPDSNQYDNDTYTWNGFGWSGLPNAGAPSPRFDTGLVYDAMNHRTLLVGGYAGDPSPQDVWVSNWSTVP